VFDGADPQPAHDACRDENGENSGRHPRARGLHGGPIDQKANHGRQREQFEQPEDATDLQLHEQRRPG
jgi:hypothetical protein